MVGHHRTTAHTTTTTSPSFPSFPSFPLISFLLDVLAGRRVEVLLSRQKAVVFGLVHKQKEAHIPYEGIQVQGRLEEEPRGGEGGVGGDEVRMPRII